jgi:probable metal-binding protein
MTHGHEVLAMMQGRSYTEKSLLEAIIEKFGTEERFYTCSAENLTAQELINFLKDHGKFLPMGDGFTVDTGKVCENE